MRKWVNWLIVSVVGVFIAIAAVVFNLWILPMIVQYQVSQTLALNPNTDAWSNFVNTPIPITMSIYFFNLVNPEGIFKGEKPIVKEVGPYVYQETKEKRDIKLFEDKDTVEYHQYTKFMFDEKASYPRKENDEITPLNIYVYVIANLMGELKYLDLMDELIDYAMPDMLGERFDNVLKTTPNEILFSGIEFKCSDKNVSIMTKLICSGIKNFPGLEHSLVVTPEGNVQGSIFGFKNRTHNGLFEVNRGRNDFSQLGKIVAWNGKTTLDIWGGPKCNQIVGYDETILPPMLTSNSVIQLFNTDVCGTLDMIYSEPADFQGIDGYKFISSPEFMGDVIDYPDAKCFCPQSIEGITVPSECLLKGVIDVSSCLNMPVILSHPHFYDANETYLKGIDGLSPNKNQHETYLEVEPLTGTPLSGVKRIQLNVQSKKKSALKLFQNQTNTVFPILWFEEKAELGELQISILRDQLLRVMKISNIVQWIFIGVGILMGLVGLVMSILSLKNVEKERED